MWKIFEGGSCELSFMHRCMWRSFFQTLIISWTSCLCWTSVFHVLYWTCTVTFLPQVLSMLETSSHGIFLQSFHLHSTCGFWVDSACVYIWACYKWGHSVVLVLIDLPVFCQGVKNLLHFEISALVLFLQCTDIWPRILQGFQTFHTASYVEGIGVYKSRGSPLVIFMYNAEVHQGR